MDFGGLCTDLSFLANLPELCDVTFLVGAHKEPVCAVKAILAARSPVFREMLFPAEQRLAGTGKYGKSLQDFNLRKITLFKGNPTIKEEVKLTPSDS